MHFKKIIALALCGCICTMSVVSPAEQAYASTRNVVLDLAKKTSLTKGLISKFLGFVGKANLITAVVDGIVQGFSDVTVVNESEEEGLKKYKLNQEYVQAVYDACMDYIKAGGDDFFLMSGGKFSGDYPSVYSDVYSYLKMLLDNKKITLTQYSLARQFIASKAVGVWGVEVYATWDSPSRNLSVFQFPLDYYYYLDSSSNLCFYDVSTETTGYSSSLSWNLEGFLRYGEDLPEEGEHGTMNFYPMAKQDFYLYGSLRIFYNYTSLMNYLIGERDYYYTQNIYNFDVNKEITLNETEINNLYTTNWDTVNNNIYNNVVNKTIGQNLSDSDIEKIIQKELKAYFGDESPGADIGEEDNNSPVISDDVLQQFLDFWDKLLGKIESIIELLETNNTNLDKVIISLGETNTTLDDLVKVVGNINFDIDNDIEASGGVNAFMAGMVNNFNRVAEQAKTKFPTSLPWDIIVVVNQFSASPEVPVFKLPIKLSFWNGVVIDEELTVDLKEFDKVSKVTRTALSLTFVMFLIQLTRKMFFSDD